MLSIPTLKRMYKVLGSFSYRLFVDFFFFFFGLTTQHADDTTLMAESEEELESLLMKVRGE